MKKTLAPCLMVTALLSGCALSPDQAPDTTTPAQSLEQTVNAEIDRLLTGGDDLLAGNVDTQRASRTFTLAAGDTVLNLLRRAHAPTSLFYDLPTSDQQRLSRMSPGDKLSLLGTEAEGYTGLGIGRDGRWDMADQDRATYRLAASDDTDTATLKVHDLPLANSLDATLADSTLHESTWETLLPLLSRAFPDDNLPEGWLRLRLEHRSVDGVTTETPELVSAALSIAPAPMFMVRHQPSGEEAAYYNGEGERLDPQWVSHPIRGNYRITSEFNPHRRHPITGKIHPHNGRDFAARRGTPIVAATDGVVVHAGRRSSWGKLVILRHGNGLQTRYAHMSTTAHLAPGDKVRRGQVIGKVGTTGMSTGPHLHFEVHSHGTPRNPADFEPGQNTRLADSALNQSDHQFFADYTRLESRSLAQLPPRGTSLMAQMPLYGIGGPEEIPNNDP